MTAKPKPEPPDFYVADKRLVVAEIGLPALVYDAGARVPAQDVDRYGWHSFVHTPEHATPEE